MKVDRNQGQVKSDRSELLRIYMVIIHDSYNVLTIIEKLTTVITQF